MIHVGRFIVGALALLLSGATVALLAAIVTGFVGWARNRPWPGLRILAAWGAFALAAYAVGALLIR